jgi:hypothetical protein
MFRHTVMQYRVREYIMYIYVCEKCKFISFIDSPWTIVSLVRDKYSPQLGCHCIVTLGEQCRLFSSCLLCCLLLSLSSCQVQIFSSATFSETCRVCFIPLMLQVIPILINEVRMLYILFVFICILDGKTKHSELNRSKNKQTVVRI